MEPSLLMPINHEAEQNQAVFLDRHGEVVTLPNNALVPFARLAARGNIKRIKRYHMADIYKPRSVICTRKSSNGYSSSQKCCDWPP